MPVDCVNRCASACWAASRSGRFSSVHTVIRFSPAAPPSPPPQPATRTSSAAGERGSQAGACRHRPSSPRRCDRQTRPRPRQLSTVATGQFRSTGSGNRVAPVPRAGRAERGEPREQLLAVPALRPGAAHAPPVVGLRANAATAAASDQMLNVACSPIGASPMPRPPAAPPPPASSARDRRAAPTEPVPARRAHGGAGEDGDRAARGPARCCCCLCGRRTRVAGRPRRRRRRAVRRPAQVGEDVPSAPPAVAGQQPEPHAVHLAAPGPHPRGPLRRTSRPRTRPARSGRPSGEQRGAGRSAPVACRTATGAEQPGEPQAGRLAQAQPVRAEPGERHRRPPRGFANEMERRDADGTGCASGFRPVDHTSILAPPLPPGDRTSPRPNLQPASARSRRRRDVGPLPRHATQQ